MMKQGEVDYSEEIEANLAEATWDGEGGRRAPRPDEDGAGESPPPRLGPPLSRRVEERRRSGTRGDRRW